MEEYAYVLDYLPNGPVSARGGRGEPIIYAVGESEFRLFTLVAKPGVNLVFDQRVYMGQDAAKRTEVDHVKSRIKYTELSANAMNELPYAIEEIVRDNEAKFIRFYNVAQSLSLKKHALEELPGMGKKTVELIVEERMKKPFESFTDLGERVPAVKNPLKPIVERIVMEISEDDHKHYLFVPRDSPRSGPRDSPRRGSR